MTDDLDPEVKELFAAEKDEAPPADARDRLAGLLAPTLALPLPPPALTAAPLAPAAAGMISAAKAWTMASAAFVTGGAAVIVWTAARPVAPVLALVPTVTVPAPSLAPSTRTAISPPQPQEILDASAMAIGVQDAGTARPAAPSASMAPAGITAERALLDDARTAVRAKDCTTALRILDLHARQFPQGQLGEEREALAIDALVQAHEYGAARTRADRLRARSPNSLFLPMVNAALRAIP